ncbi:TetR/AcrR family transcriptional regulator [Kaistia sp. 32K]|uniref:TetR/AcrR family transcriptional regulator n=1 Tax=Kaistia sp. 32K TaxID=2795690 RepID=UPI001FD192AB|nr:TetR/AcrR family transcriptional regulator [Kaistia sp. 32K]
MDLFWSKGYEGAQLTDLTAAMGIAPPSFYAAFASKEAAFCEAVDLYMSTIGAPPMAALEAEADVREAVRAMLHGSIHVALSTRTGGCLLILGVVNHLPENQAARDHLLAARRTTLELIRARLRRGLAEGDLAPETDIDSLAAYCHGILQAISFQARDGAGRAELEALVERSMKALG